MKNNHYESLFEGGKYGQLNMASVPRVCGNVHQSPLIELQHFLFWKLTIRQRRKKKKDLCMVYSSSVGGYIILFF